MKTLNVILSATVLVLSFFLIAVTKKAPREVPVEVIKEVEFPVQVTKEVESPLSIKQQMQIYWGKKYVATDFPVNELQLIAGVESVAVDIRSSGAIEKSFGTSIKNKFELVLLQNDVKINPDSSLTVFIYIEGLWDENEMHIIYSAHHGFMGRATFRNFHQELNDYPVTIIQGRSNGYAGKEIYKEKIWELTQLAAEEVSNSFLKASMIPSLKNE